MESNKPQCVGFIMDGNRRWAKREGMPTFEGHRQGYKNFKEMIRMVHRAHISHLVCYAFSTENWNRADEEVSFLMNLFRIAFKDIRSETDAKKINYRFIGQINRLPSDLQTFIITIESENHTDVELTVWIALSYGGRAEIVDATNKAIQEGKEVTEETFSTLLSTCGMPDPDLIIRTSGEKRLSNFLLWQSAYSELFFTDTLWPDFGEVEFKGILEQYSQRKRRRGK